MIRIADAGAGGVTGDPTGCIKFLGISSNLFVQIAFRDYSQEGDSTISLLVLAAQGCAKHYPMDTKWPSGDQPWYTLSEGMKKLKEEVMKTAIMIGEAETYNQTVVAAPHHNILVITAPPAHKNLMMTFLLGETGNPLNTVLD